MAQFDTLICAAALPHTHTPAFEAFISETSDTMRLIVAAVVALLVVAPAAALLPAHSARLTERRLAAQRRGHASALPVTMPPSHYHTTALDHFDAENAQTWEQRFFVNDTFWNKESGPVFLYIEVRHSLRCTV